MSSGTQKETVQFGPERQQLLGQIFGQGPGFFGNQGQPGIGLADLSPIFGNLQPQYNVSPLQRQATVDIQNMLRQDMTSPEMTVFNQLQNALGAIGTGAGQFGQIDVAMQPIFQRNLAEGLSQLGAQAPGRFGSAFLQQGTNLAQRATQDYNLFIQQARQQDIANKIQASLALNTLGQAAGEAQLRPLQAQLMGGQFGFQQDALRAQLSQMGITNQQQLQLAILQMLNTPTGQTTRQSGGVGGFLGGITGFGLPFALGMPFGGGQG